MQGRAVIVLADGMAEFAGMVLESWIEGIGTIRNTCIAPA